MEPTPFFRILRDMLMIEGGDIISWGNNGQDVLLLDIRRAKRDLFPIYYKYVVLQIVFNTQYLMIMI